MIDLQCRFQRRRGGFVALSTAASGVRQGFTLLELVVVVAIVGILAAFALTGLVGALNAGRESQTRTVIAIADGVLQTRLEAYQSTILNRHPDYQISDAQSDFVTRFSAVNPDSLSAGAGSFFATKSLFASVFPQRFQDLCGFDGRPGAPGVNDAGSGGGQDIIGSSTAANNVFEDGAVIDLYELGLGGTATDDPAPAAVIRAAVLALGDTVDLSLHTSQTESAELLYLCITNPLFPGFPTVRPDDIPASFLEDSDGDGLVELIDGWGQPLRFYTNASGLLRASVNSSGVPVAPTWTWGTSGVRTDIPADRVELAYILGGQALGISPPLRTISGSSDADAGHPLNRDLDDRLNAVRLRSTGNMAAGDQLLSDDPGGPDGYNIRIPNGTISAGKGPNLPIALGTRSFPLIVSAGPDETFGLGDPTSDSILRYAAPTASPFVLASSPALDNVTNLQGGPK